MCEYLKKESIVLSLPTVHAYMKGMNLRSIARRRKNIYSKGEKHRIFDNLLNRKFKAETKNTIYLTDFTYLFLEDGTKRYNCTIIDLYDRSVVATLNSDRIDARLAIDTLSIALENNKIEKGVILHSDQGTQYTSREFTEYCEKHSVQQSMSRAGCPYDNAPMERFFNTLKNEYVYHHSFKSAEAMDEGIYEFTRVHYNFA